ncbi:IS3 family transposase [Anaerocolumna xylanovorans]|uniref:IS3 family transposase n=1 Tax=Anaerocolumna xylanovorans TaxID=100134 RepID=UPI000936BEBC|nr:IS3 family transposase [Anaerocolumna xylanovorans]
MKQPYKYASVKEIIHQVFHENKGRYGYRKITLELCNRGYPLNHKTVQNLMKLEKLKCTIDYVNIVLEEDFI